MVSIIENWATVEGVVKSISENTDIKGYFQVELELQSSEDLEGFPNLARLDEGKTIRINIQRERLKDLQIKPGEPLRATVRKAFGQVYFIG